MNTAEKLHALGWRVSTPELVDGAVRAFQLGYTRSTLKVDGVPGPLTTHALDATLADGNRITDHFTWSEYRCHCGQTLPGCRGILVHHELARSVEATRVKFYPSGLHLLSAYRCPEWNAHVKGAHASRHIVGEAIDLDPLLTVAQAEEVGRWRGIGYSPSRRRVVHLDVRATATAETPDVFPDGR